MIESICPNCGTKKVFDDDKAGKKYKCTNCETTVLIEKIDFTEDTQKEVKLEVTEEPKKKSWGVGAISAIAVIFIIIGFASNSRDFGSTCLGIGIVLLVIALIVWIIRKVVTGH